MSFECKRLNIYLKNSFHRKNISCKLLRLENDRSYYTPLQLFLSSKFGKIWVFLFIQIVFFYTSSFSHLKLYSSALTLKTKKYIRNEKKSKKNDCMDFGMLHHCNGPPRKGTAPLSLQWSASQRQINYKPLS